MERSQSLDLANRALLVVDLLQGDDEAVGESAASIHVGVRAGADAAEDLVPGRDLRPPVDAPASGPVRHRVVLGGLYANCFGKCLKIFDWCELTNSYPLH